MKTISIFGPSPRELYGYDREKYKSFVYELKSLLQHYLDPDETTIYTNATQGIAQLAFWSANNLKLTNNIKNVVWIPYANMSAKWKNSGLFSKREYELIKRKADKINMPEQNDTNNAFISIEKCNEKMIDNSDLIVALYPDEISWRLPNQGITADAMRYAAINNKKILHIMPSEESSELTISDYIFYG